jgi:hypothetical protein
MGGRRACRHPARNRDRRAGLEAVKAVTGLLERALTSRDESAKWQAASKVMAGHDIVSGRGQLLLFTEFTDTARSFLRAAGLGLWALVRLKSWCGCSRWLGG